MRGVPFVCRERPQFNRRGGRRTVGRVELDVP